MILVLAGTAKGGDIVELLKENDREVLASATTPYGANLLREKEVEVLQKQLSAVEMETLLGARGIKTVIDATHPFACRVSKNAIQATGKTGRDYFNYQRAEVDTTFLEAEDLLVKVKNFKEAARKAQAYKRILLTVGSKNLKVFTEQIPDWQQKLVARILPDTRFVERARGLGFKPSRLIALQGPFSVRLNRVLLQDFKIEVLVTKASGYSGGLESKLKAALALQIPVIMIERPRLNYPRVINSLQQLQELLVKGEI